MNLTHTRSAPSAHGGASSHVTRGTARSVDVASLTTFDHVLFSRDIALEVRTRALYTCGQLFGPFLETGTRLVEALQLLRDWGS